MSDKVFVDSSVLLYLLDKSSPSKKLPAAKILKAGPSISPQIVFECLNVSTRKFKLPKNAALGFIERILRYSKLEIEDSATVEYALLLFRKHSLQVFDTKIVAAALLSDCKILYSEDLHHKQVFERKLRVMNPFI